MMGERHDGKKVMIERSFRSRDEAEENCVITPKEWRRFWVQEIPPSSEFRSKRGGQNKRERIV